MENAQPSSPLSAPPPPPQKSSAMKWILIGCGTLAGLGLLACGGCSLFAYMLYQKIAPAIQEAERFAKANAVIEEKIGDLQHTQFNQAKSRIEESGGTLVLDVRGPKGAGTLTINFLKEGDRYRATGGSLVMEDGTTYPLAGTGGAPPK